MRENIHSPCPLPPGSKVFGHCRDTGGETQEASVEQQTVIRAYWKQHGLVLLEIFVDATR